jgi:hypothetical protein
MSEKGKKKNQDKMAAKKAAVLGAEKKNRLPLLVALIGVVIIVPSACLKTARRVILNTRTVNLPSAILFLKVQTALSGRHLMPAMFAGRRAKAITRKVTIWFVETAAAGLPPCSSTKSKAAATRRP